MAKKSAVVNNGTEEYVEVFHGKEYRIPAKGELIMSRHEAIEFLGSYAGMEKHKPLQVRHIDGVDAAPGFVCNLCGGSFPTGEALEAHIKKDHADKVVKKVFACPFCKFVANDRAGLYTHIQTHRDKSIKEIVDALEKVG